MYLYLSVYITSSAFTFTGKKPYSCKHCDFHAVDASLLRSHLHKQHQDLLGLYSKQTTILDKNHQNGPKASRYMDYLRSRSALLSQPYWNPYTCLTGYVSAESNIKTEKPNGTDVKGQGSTSDTGSLLNLSSMDTSEGDGTVNRSVKTEGLVRHQCPYCVHSSHYPEVLWIHQRVAHKVDGSSSMAPKWAPSTTIPKSLKAAGAQWRRTGPPPFLEGKDCPALHTPRTQRTQPPGSATQSSSSNSKHSASKTQSSVPKSRNQSKDSRASDGTQSGGKMGLPQKKPGEKRQTEETGSKSSGPQASSSSGGKNAPSFQPSSSPKYHTPAVEANFPQEGLGFMLGRSRGGTPASAAADRSHFRRQSCDSTSGAKGPDLWAAMNMWGHKAYLEHLRFAQGKTEPSGEMPMDMDILGLLKNYNPHDLAALYQHWGFVDPRIDPQGEQSLCL